MKRARCVCDAIYPQLDDAHRRHDHGRRRRGAAVDRPPRRTSSTCSTRWGWPRRWGSASRCTRPTQQVVVLDGDGSILMNLGGLTTLARYRPRNLVHVVFDNESLLSVGGFPTATSTGQRHRRRSPRRPACRAPRPCARSTSSRARSTTRWRRAS